MLTNKTLMITGGTGSFGNTVLQRFIHTDIKEIRVFSRDEKKQEDLRITLNNPKLKFYVGDVRDFDSINASLKNVDYIFHAAALKQVPSCEFFPLEALKTNVLGTENVMNAALMNGVKKVVVLSTDKAVYPINAMGITKALMEKVMIAKARMCNSTETIFCGTRYGNVMASRGSVIPLFVEQIKSGSSLTITDPSMTRFLMSLQDSVDLVLHAFSHGKQGDIFVQKAPASTVSDLANALLKIFKSNGSIKIIGARHGEKLYESLLSREENAKVTDLGNYFCVPMDARGLNYNHVENAHAPTTSVFDDYTSHNTHRLTIDEVIDVLLKLDYIKNEISI